MKVNSSAGREHGNQIEDSTRPCAPSRGKIDNYSSALVMVVSGREKKAPPKAG
jgi:hypothetical protein